MSQQQDLLIDVVHRLEESGIPYMIVGSVAAGIFGEPRATNDVDLVVNPTRPQLDLFLSRLGEAYYVSPEAAHEALAHRRMFNIIDGRAGEKADLIMLKTAPFDLEAFRRRCTVTVEGVSLSVTSPPDVILSKLLWSKQADSERQFRDAFGVAFMQWEKLDRDYLRKWARELGVEDLLEKLCEQVAKHRSA